MRRAGGGADTWPAACALLLGSAACASADPIRTDPPAGYPNAYAMSDCAPWDGPATTIYLSPNEAEPEALPGSEVAPPLIWISVYQPRAALDGQRFEIDQRATAGAVRCTDVGLCEPATDGRIRFGNISDTRIIGDVILDFVGDTISGGFDAAWIARHVPCG